MYCEQDITLTGQKKADPTDVVGPNLEKHISDMAFCTFSAASDLWPVQGACELSAPAEEWPMRNQSNIKEDEANQILDFEKLENEIMRNVLGEDNFESEKVPRLSEVFPSFNYLPAPIPPSLPKSNSSFKLHSKGHWGSPTKRQTRALQRQRTANTLDVTDNKASERRKSSYKQSKNVDGQNPRDRTSATDFGYVKQHDKKSIKHRAFKTVTIHDATISRPTKSPASITIARRQSKCIPMVTTCSYPSMEAATSNENPFAFTQNNVTPHKTRKNKWNNNSVKLDQANNIESRPFSFNSSKSSEQRQVTNSNRTNSGRRNMTLRQTTRSDQKKRKIGEKAKTFAQIVATGTAKSSHRMQN